MAIAFDAAAGETRVGGGTASVSHNHTVGSGSNRIMFIGVTDQSGIDDNVTAVSFNGVAATKIDDLDEAAGDGQTYLYYLVNPDSGTHSVQATRSNTSNALMITSASYSGASQTGVPDAFDSDQTSTDPFTGTVTTTADNAWLVMVAYVRSALPASAGTGSTLRTAGLQQNVIVDSNGAKTPAGSHSLEVNPSGTDSMNYIIASFAPATAAASGGTGRLMTMGMGR